MNTVATREDYLAHALEAEIRERVKQRSWYRSHRDTYPWTDLERENRLTLRLLFSIRRDGLRDYGLGRLHADRQLKAHAEAVDAALWAASLAVGEYVVDVPLADRGDHFVGVGL